MDSTSVFFAWPTVVFGIFIYVLVLGARTVLEKVWPSLVASPFWRDLILPSLPVLLGMGVAVFVPTYPLPDAISSTGARVIYGTVVGFFSAWMYRVLKAFVRRQWGDVDDRPITAPGGKP